MKAGDFPEAPEGVDLIGDSYYLEGTHAGGEGGGSGRTHSIIQTYINEQGIQ
jgi:hypothetical protein